MGFKDRLKSWFIVEDGTSSANKTTEELETLSTSTKTTTPTTSATPAVSKPVASSASSSTGVTESAAGEKGQVTSKFIDILFGAMEQNNLNGFDYLEFKQSLKSLEKMPMDEQTRYQSAFAMASTMGATPQKLVETANHYIQVLTTEEKKFEQALANQRKTQIGDREEQIKGMEAGIQEKAQQIKKLTQEIEQHQQQLATLKNEISDAVLKVESTKNNFIASYHLLVSQIQGDIDNMKKHLK